jgi:hypothetical protein
VHGNWLSKYHSLAVLSKFEQGEERNLNRELGPNPSSLATRDITPSDSSKRPLASNPSLFGVCCDCSKDEAKGVIIVEPQSLEAKNNGDENTMYKESKSNRCKVAAPPGRAEVRSVVSIGNACSLGGETSTQHPQ